MFLSSKKSHAKKLFTVNEETSTINQIMNESVERETKRREASHISITATHSLYGCFYIAIKPPSKGTKSK